MRRQRKAVGKTHKFGLLKIIKRSGEKPVLYNHLQSITYATFEKVAMFWEKKKKEAFAGLLMR